MNASNDGGLGTVKMIVGVIFLILVLVALYYLYKYLFTSSGLEIKVVNNEFVSAKTNEKSFAVSKTYPDVPVIYTGGEFTVSTWVYVTDWKSVNGGKPKHIFTLGKDIGSAAAGASATNSTNPDTVNEQTLTVYLDAYNNTLHTAVSLAASGSEATDKSYTIMKTDIATEAGQLNDASLKGKAGSKCSVGDVELQKWVLFTFCLNNKVMDIYMDGKLARSCVLPSMYSVGSDPSKPISLKMAGYGGFGGFIGRTVMSNYALNPEEVWKLYMTGPGPEMSIFESFGALFDPSYYKNVKFPELKWD
jgi:hypothetical protein